jgi:putative phosphoribosyl transferase
LRPASSRTLIGAAGNYRRTSGAAAVVESGEAQDDTCVRTLFDDRAEAGRALAAALAPADLGNAVVVGLARGGVAVAAEVARALSLPLDALAVRKIGYPSQPEYGIGAITPGAGGVYVRSDEGVGQDALSRAIGSARAAAEALDTVLHERRRPVALGGRTALLVDDGLATGSTMVAAVRWARAQGATRVVVAVPVGAVESVRMLQLEADEVVCPYAQPHFGAVGFWYRHFEQVETDEVLALLDELGAPTAG